MHNQILIVFAIVIVMYWIATYNTDSYEMYMDGLWVSTDDFNSTADIETMTLFLGPPQGYLSSTREGVIVIISDGNEIAQGFTIKYRTAWGGVGIGAYTVVSDIVFEDEQLMEPVVNITVDMLGGTMAISRGEITYGIFNKSYE